MSTELPGPYEPATDQILVPPSTPRMSSTGTSQGTQSNSIGIAKPTDLPAQPTAANTASTSTSHSESLSARVMKANKLIEDAAQELHRARSSRSTSDGNAMVPALKRDAIREGAGAAKPITLSPESPKSSPTLQGSNTGKQKGSFQEIVGARAPTAPGTPSHSRMRAGQSRIHTKAKQNPWTMSKASANDKLHPPSNAQTSKPTWSKYIGMDDNGTFTQDSTNL